MLYDLFAIFIVAEFNRNKEEVVYLNNENGSEIYNNILIRKEFLEYIVYIIMLFVFNVISAATRNCAVCSKNQIILVFKTWR